MSDCDRTREAIGAYVLGALDEDEAAQVRGHLDRCPRCRAEHDSLGPLPGLLTVATGAERANAEPLPHAFEERLLDAYARDRAATPVRRRRRLRRLRLHWPALAAATAAVAAAGVGVVVVTGGEEPSPRYDVAFRSTGAVPGATARAELESVPGGTALHLWVRNLPRDPRAVYEVVCEAPTWKASAGTFRVNVEGRAYVVLTTAARRGEYDSIRVVRRSRDANGQIVARDVLAARLS
jgi:anti-sigma factor RsiW